MGGCNWDPLLLFLGNYTKASGEPLETIGEDFGMNSFPWVKKSNFFKPRSASHTVDGSEIRRLQQLRER